MDGILLVDKPKGWTSFDVVAKIRSILRQAMSNEIRVVSGTQNLTAQSSQLKTLSPKVKVGHTGTLDPLATGLLILMLGTYCKRAQEFSKLDKTYEVAMKLGMTSTTGDEEGVKTPVSDNQSAKDKLETALKSFVGEIKQVPPAFSAIKVNGKRAYELARAGKDVKLEPRSVKIYSLKLTDYTYPDVKFIAEVSSGTYIRTLVEDIGHKIGTGAYTSDLRRTTVGSYKIENANKIDGLTPEQIEQTLQLLA